MRAYVAAALVLAVSPAGAQSTHWLSCKFDAYTRVYRGGYHQYDISSDETTDHDVDAGITESVSDSPWACLNSKTLYYPPVGETEYYWERYECTSTGRVLTEANYGTFDQLPSWASDLWNEGAHIDYACNSSTYITKPRLEVIR